MLQSPFINTIVDERIEGTRATAAGKRPKLSLASLIGQAILATQYHRARLSTIYEWISERYPDYYRLNCGGWQNSIRHNLTINKAFTRLPKEDGDAPGKGAFWTIHPDHVHQFKDGIFIGKIRSSEYRSSAKPRNASSKRLSAPDLPSYGNQERFGYYAFDNDSVQSLTDSSTQSHKAVSASAHHQFSTYDQHRHQNSAISVDTADALSGNNADTHESGFSYIPAAPLADRNNGSSNFPHYQYFPPTTAQQPMFYGVVQSGVWPSQGTTEHSHPVDGHCECSYCLTLPIVSSVSPHPECLPNLSAHSEGAATIATTAVHKLVDTRMPMQQANFASPLYNVAGANQIGHQSHHYPPFYTTVGAHENEELTMAHLQQFSKPEYSEAQN
eukprot:Partr_v1_DN27761_c0_g1_i2_m66957 putative Forkhead transcription factor